MKTKLLTFLTLLAVLLAGAGPAPAAPAWQSKVDPRVLAGAAQGETEFLVIMGEQADLSAAAAQPNKEARGRYVYQQLVQTAARTQAPLLAYLQAQEAPHRSFWVANMIWVRGGQVLVAVLAQRPEVARLDANPKVAASEPVQAPAGPMLRQPQGIEPSIARVNAPQVWAAGYTGQGAVIGGQDTGYSWEHVALKPAYRGWDGSRADHNYNWHDAIHSGGGVCGNDSLFPCDDAQHGTHTMGTLVGDDGAGNQVGMAPGARWIACRNMAGYSGIGSADTYAECFQWFIAPTDLANQKPDPTMAPDVINNSWGCPPSEGCAWDVLQTVVSNTVAAGIVVVASAGNKGPGCNSVQDPPSMYAATFSVGATDNSDAIVGFSSRGPGMYTGLLKPNVTAPGSLVYSSVPGNSYGYMSGTSMAAPHVAGLVALLVSAEPSLRGQVDTIRRLVEETALPLTTAQACGDIPGTAIPNNTYGWGRIDALAALNRLKTPHSLGLQKSAAPETVLPGQAITYTLTVTHAHPVLPAHTVIVSDVLPAGTVLITATLPFTRSGDTITWQFDQLGVNEQRSLNLVVSVPVGFATAEVVNQDYRLTSAETPTPTLGSPVRVPVAPSLQVSKRAAGAVLPGKLLTYTLEVATPMLAVVQHNVVLTDRLPAGTVFVTATQPHTFDGQTVRWDFPTLAGAAQQASLVVQAPIAPGEVIENAAYQAASSEAPTPVSGPAVSTTITDAHPGVSLSPSRALDARTGENFIYTHAITNSGDFTDTLVFSLGSNLGWTALVDARALELGPGQAGEAEISVSVPVTATGGSLETVLLTVRTENAPPVSVTVTDTVTLRYHTLYLPLAQR